MNNDIRNIAVIAHVDHGKTTLIDFLLKQSHTFRENQEEMNQTTILDSNPLERERGITIFAKNAAIYYKNAKINIIDTPGHADFSGEVERTLNMADGALLIVDAQEGPMPQTKFVLKKALELGLKIIVIINKVDKKLANIPQTIERINDLFLELAITHEHLDFPIFYSIGREGKASDTLEGVNNSTDLSMIFEAIIKFIPMPEIEDGKFQMIATSLSPDQHKGKHVIGKIRRGELKTGDSVALIKASGEKVPAKVENIYVFDGLGTKEVGEAKAGEIVSITGVGSATIGDSIVDPLDPTPLPRIEIEEPTIKIAIGPNTSPFVGKDGKFTNSRQILERLNRELETNVGLRLNVGGDKFVVSGRGELHLSVLIETLRREGYEFEVGKPQVITKIVDGVEMEPVEDVIIDIPDEFLGIITQELGTRKADMTNLYSEGNGMTRIEYRVPSKALIGLRSLLLTSTKGTAIINAMFSDYAPVVAAHPKARNGVLIASEGGSALTYGLANAQGRGITFIDPGTKVYEGMIIGENSRRDDIEINVTKEKKQTNMRASSADISVALTPALKMSLEQYLDFLEEDELLEVTPLNLRLRKKFLTGLERRRN
jgi:GTP-binding protein